MPRSGDVAFPSVELHTDPRLLAYPVRPVVAISGLQTVAVWDDPANLWDAELAVTTSSRVGTALVGHAKVGQP